ncbi:esterase family protein [Grimontia kaedaensis]|uniref:Esterase family protein n=1 Tax=Grimontia kaedaensis TaxID=2872157 RepID=A0ABY4X2T4_9GAMM|nr:alpha/beta hydrolase-fold protein [Grimontia kaedaensis]USH05516.1 esterase family protein [Grimontia kaedaensis]
MTKQSLFFSALFVIKVCVVNASEIEEVSVPAESLKNAMVEQEKTQSALVYLPTDYRKKPHKKYPVVYFLHGFGGTAQGFFASSILEPNIKRSMDALVAKNRVSEMIVVVPDTNTMYRAAWYQNNRLTGDWADFIRTDLVDHIDIQYRTIKNPKSRALAGHSMGAYGAIDIGLANPDIFGSVIALSPPTGLLQPGDYALFKQFYDAQKQQMVSVESFDELPHFGQAIISMAALFTADENYKPTYLPESINRVAFEKLSGLALSNKLERYEDESFSMPIYTELGVKEGEEAVRDFTNFTKLYQAKGYEVKESLFEGGHLDKLYKRIDTALIFASENMLSN